jgi:hypothetical protein
MAVTILKPDKSGIRMVIFRKNRASDYQTVQKPDKYVQYSNGPLA